jgi:hypothetical protein
MVETSIVTEIAGAGMMRFSLFVAIENEMEQ